MKASKECVELWNGWYRRVSKGETLDPRAIIVENVPSNVIWDNNYGRVSGGF